MDVTRVARNVRRDGAVTVGGRARDGAGIKGTHGRSWGVRPIGAGDPPPISPRAAPQFFWLWAAVVFNGLSLLAHTNDDGEGQPRNRSAGLVDHAGGTGTSLHQPRFERTLAPGTQRAAACKLPASLPDGRAIEVRLDHLMGGGEALHAQADTNDPRPA